MQTYPTLTDLGGQDLAMPSWRQRSLVWMVIVSAGALIIGRQIVSGGTSVRFTIAAVAMVALAIPALEHPRKAVTGLFILLPFLGMIRHMFLSNTGVTALDPMLLIPTAVTITILVALIMGGQMDFDGTLCSKLVFLLLVVGLIQVFNPGQGSILVGLTGVMINLIPITFFFIGRSIGDQQFTAKILRIVGAIGVLAALYGLKQLFFGFLGFEQDWLGKQGNYQAGTVGATVRPFSFFNNASEYAAYLQIAFVIVFATLLFRPQRSRLWWLAMSATIAYGGFLIGSRGFTVKVGFAIILLLAARAKNKLLAVGIVICLSAAVFTFSATTTSDETIQENKEGADQLIEQQLRALRDPFNPAQSTLPVHWNAAVRGVSYAIMHQQAGLGTGVTTRGASKFKGIQAGTEFDVGDAFLSLGIAGGFLYSLIIVVAITQAARVRKALPGPVWVGIWAVAFSSIGAWLNGGNYSIPPLIWFLLGASDGMYKALRKRGLLDARGRVPRERFVRPPFAS